MKVVGDIIWGENSKGDSIPYIITEITNGEVESEKVEDWVMKNVVINFNGSMLTIKEITELYVNDILKTNTHLE